MNSSLRHSILFRPSPRKLFAAVDDLPTTSLAGITRRVCGGSALALSLALLTIASVTAAVAQQPPKPGVDLEIRRLAQWMSGEFDTFAQVASDEAEGAAYKHVRAVMRIVPARIAGLTAAPLSRTFYVEQALADAEDKPYRQRVYLITRLNGRLVNRIYRIRDPEQFVGGYRKAELLAGLVADRLILEEGCDLVWERAGEKLYRGRAGADGRCRTTLRGATRVTSQVEITPDSITSLDQGFDDAGAHKWGPPPGTPGHIFRRRVK